METEWLIQEIERSIQVTQKTTSDESKSAYYKLGAWEGCVKTITQLIEHYKKENRDD